MQNKMNNLNMTESMKTKWTSLKIIEVCINKKKYSYICYRQPHNKFTIFNTVVGGAFKVDELCTGLEDKDKLVHGHIKQSSLHQNN